jgi:3-acetyloctanal aminotransferase
VKFGFIVHPLNPAQLRAFAMDSEFVERLWRPHEFMMRFLRSNREMLRTGDADWIARAKSLPNFRVRTYPLVRSDHGESTSGIVVSIPLLPDQILQDQARALEMVKRACEECAEWGAEIVGLGAYTGIIGSRGEKVGESVGVPVTTGNSYTVHSSLLGLRRLLGRIGRSLTGRKVVVIGYQGSIGLAIAKLLARQGVDLVLVGRGLEKFLPRSLATITHESGVSVECCASVEEAVGKSDVVLSATSSGAVIDPKWLAPGTVVLDIAQPRDVIGSESARRDVLIIDGGLVQLPEAGGSGDVLDAWTYGTIFSCLAETMILALDERAEAFSVGRELSLERIEEIGRRGETHGFGVREFLSFGQPVDRGRIHALRKTEFRRSSTPLSFVVGVEEAGARTGEEVRDAYREYMDPFVASTLRMLSLDRHYVRAEGAYLWDEEGRRYLDFMAGFGAVNVGHHHPRVVEAIGAALRKEVPNFVKPANGSYTTALAETLAMIAPGDLDTTFFCNSGTEAVEGAIKVARMFTRRTRVVHAEGSFHGKTLGSLSVTDNPRFRRPFEPLVPDVARVPYGDLEPLAKILEPGDVAAFIVEPVQGEGGIVVAPPGYLKEAERLCKRHGTLFVLDEVQTGFGRTGKMFAAEHWGLEPDILTLAKSLSGGEIPIGAFVTRSDIWDRVFGSVDTYNLHTSTFGGNNVACAAGLAAIEVLYEENLVERARCVGEHLLARLRGLPARYRVVRDVRGMGLMLGVEFQDFFADMLAIPAMQRMLGHLPGQVVPALCRLSGDATAAVFLISELLNEHRILAQVTLHRSLTLRVQPPLVVGREEVDAFADALETVCRQMQVTAAMGETMDSATWSR